MIPKHSTPYQSKKFLTHKNTHPARGIYSFLNTPPGIYEGELIA